MARRKGGDTLRMAAAARATAPADQPARADVPMANTGLHIPVRLLTRLRIAAANRVETRGYGRPSVSELIVDVLERHLDEIEAELLE